MTSHRAPHPESIRRRTVPETVGFPEKLTNGMDGAMFAPLHSRGAGIESSNNQRCPTRPKQARFLMAGHSGRPSGLPLSVGCGLSTCCCPVTSSKAVGRVQTNRRRPIWQTNQRDCFAIPWTFKTGYYGRFVRPRHWSAPSWRWTNAARQRRKPTPPSTACYGMRSTRLVASWSSARKLGILSPKCPFVFPCCFKELGTVGDSLHSYSVIPHMWVRVCMRNPP